MVTHLRDLLLERGTELDRVHVELFHGFQKPNVADDFTPATVKVRLRGEQHEVRLVAGDTVLEFAPKAGLDAAYACMGGACGTCKAKVLRGSVAMEQNLALSQTVVDAGTWSPASRIRPRPRLPSTMTSES